MTDKELRKLSRLELLELLLETGKENEVLKEKISKLEAENKTAQNIENLSVATRHVENILKYANRLTSVLGTPSGDDASAEMPVAVAEKYSDADIYRRILCVFIKNDEILRTFPEDVQEDVRERIRVILEKNKNN